jgi:predicted lipid carrier protein YhbT
MKKDNIPAPLARAAMRIIPASLLQRMIDILLGSMNSHHPRLFSNLERLKACVIRITPSDLPHSFILAFGQGPTSLTVSSSKDRPCDAGVKGKLEALLNLLEGSIDSDMLFFSRDIEITGDTSVVVALRNTIDREEINLLDDITALCGPFARPVRKAALLMGVAAERIKERLAEVYHERHPAAKDPAATAECDKLRAEVQTLKTRLAKLEVHRKRTEAA